MEYQKLWTWLFLDSEELKTQLQDYNSWNVFKSLRKLSVLFIAFYIIVNIVLVWLGHLRLNVIWPEMILWVVLAILVYFGKRWAIIGVMILWTLDTIYIAMHSNHINIIVPIVLWLIYMDIFWKTYQVETAKRKIK